MLALVEEKQDSTTLYQTVDAILAVGSSAGVDSLAGFVLPKYWSRSGLN